MGRDELGTAAAAGRSAALPGGFVSGSFRFTGLPRDVDPATLLGAMPDPVLVVDDGNFILWVNNAGEQFLEASAATLRGCNLSDLLPLDSPLFSLIETVRSSGSSIAEYSVPIETPRLGAHVMTIQVAPLVEQPELTRLICDESERIVALLDRMEAFSDARPIERTAVNIHEVLERVRKVAHTGFARHHRFVEEYDPSLPSVFGNHDMLVQVFLNLVKNAAEALPDHGGEIGLSTSYQQGVRLAVPGSDSRVHLPLVVAISDNGEGIPEDLRAHLFDPFVTTKRNGTGLGLALVAKIIGDHGGVIEFDSQPRRTIFRVFLPTVPAAAVAR